MIQSNKHARLLLHLNESFSPSQLIGRQRQQAQLVLHIEPQQARRDVAGLSPDRQLERLVLGDGPVER